MTRETAATASASFTYERSERDSPAVTESGAVGLGDETGFRRHMSQNQIDLAAPGGGETRVSSNTRELVVRLGYTSSNNSANSGIMRACAVRVTCGVLPFKSLSIREVLK
jgi:hypothetical protein